MASKSRKKKKKKQTLVELCLMISFIHFTYYYIGLADLDMVACSNRRSYWLSWNAMKKNGGEERKKGRREEGEKAAGEVLSSGGG